MSDDPRHRPGRARRALAGALLLLATACGNSEATIDPVAGAGAATKDGLRIGFTIQPADGGSGQVLTQGRPARVSLRVTDEVAGEGLAGLHLGAWLVPRPKGAPAPTAKEVPNVVRKLMQAKIGQGASTNLNAYYFVTLNSDQTVALLDPLLDFTRTRMKQVLKLPNQGADLVFGPGHELLFVSIPQFGNVAVIDSSSMSIRKSVATGKEPRRLACQPVTGRVWVSADGSDEVFVLDGRSGALVETLPVGAGPKLFAFDEQGRYAFVCTRDTGAVTVFRTQDGTSKNLARLEAAVSGMAYSAASNALYVAVRDSGSLELIDPESGERRSAVKLPAPAEPLYSAVAGRWLFACDRAGGKVHVVDCSSNQLSRSIPTGAQPCEIAFTPAYAHVYCAASKDLTLVPLPALQAGGELPTLTIPITQNDPARPDPDALGGFLAVTPDNASVLVVSRDDKRVFHYAEGMMAPRGSYQTYNRAARGVAVLDRSLQDLGNGDYSVAIPIDYAGVVDLFVFLQQPTQVFAHFEFQVAPDPQLVMKRMKDAPLAVPVPINPTTTFPVSKKVDLRFRLIDPVSREEKAGRKDVRIMIHAMKGNWQYRVAATATEDGQYSVPLVFPAVGEYQFHVQSTSLKLFYDRHRGLKVNVTDDVQTQPGKSK